MKALTLDPRTAGSLSLEHVPEPPPSLGPVLVRALSVGVCGTDIEIKRGAHGRSPAGRRRLILGHESLGRVLSAPPHTHLVPGALVVGVVRRPDPGLCHACRCGHWDRCVSDAPLEHGISGLDGFGAERFRLPIDSVIKLPERLARSGVLTEPTSVVVKAWHRVEAAASIQGVKLRRVLVTGAGPIGLLAALLGVQRGLDVRVLDRVSVGPKPGLVADLGASYYRENVSSAARAVDAILECTGSSRVVLESMKALGPNGILCLTGLSSGRHRLMLDAAALNRELVLENNIVMGSVSANRGHYREAVEALVAADPMWLERLVTRRVPLADWRQAFERRPYDVKTVIELR